MLGKEGAAFVGEGLCIPVIDGAEGIAGCVVTFREVVRW